MKTPKGKELWRNFCMTVRPLLSSPSSSAVGLRTREGRGLTGKRARRHDAVREHRARLQLWHAHPGRLHQGLRPGQHGPRSVLSPGRLALACSWPAAAASPCNADPDAPSLHPPVLRTQFLAIEVRLLVRLGNVGRAETLTPLSCHPPPSLAKPGRQIARNKYGLNDAFHEAAQRGEI